MYEKLISKRNVKVEHEAIIIARSIDLQMWDFVIHDR